MISTFRCLPTSTSLGERVHIEQSFVGKVLSSWAMWPPEGRRLLDEVDLVAAFGQVEGALDASDTSP